MTTTEFIKHITTNVVLLAALQFIARSAGWQPAVLIAIVYPIIVIVAIGNEIAEWQRNRQRGNESEVQQ